jgi:hypothetical protein
MTPEQKAKELFGKYAMYLRANLRYDEEANEDAKECALIAVDEIIEANPIAFDEDDNCIEKQWWQEVKTEIEKL